MKISQKNNLSLKNRKILIAMGGAKGVGKTLLAKTLKNSFGYIDVFNYGQILKKLSTPLFATDFEDLPINLKTQLRNKATNYILNSPRNISILDLHYGELETERYECVIPSKLRKNLNGLILLTAPEKDILKRRTNDNKPRIINLKDVRMNVKGEYEIAIKLSNELKIKLIIIKNRSIQDALNDLKSVLALYLDLNEKHEENKQKPEEA